MMATLQLQDEKWVEKIHELAARQGITVDDVLERMIDQYEQRLEAFEALSGAFDDDVTDMSVTVRETMNDYYKRKYESVD
jgi:hypothetical protein